jgi:phage terminase small subunit
MDETKVEVKDRLVLGPKSFEALKVLTAKQRTFVLEYFVTGNAAESARTAGYSNYTVMDVYRAVLGRKEVKEALAAMVEENTKRKLATADELLERLTQIALARITDIVEIKGQQMTFRPTSEWPDDLKAAVIGIEDSQYGVKVKMADPIRAIELLGKTPALNLFPNVVKVGNEDDKPFKTEAIDSAKQRLEDLVTRAAERLGTDKVPTEPES